MKRCCFAVALLLPWLAPAAAREQLVYFGTYTGSKSKGIYISQLNPATGRLTAPELAAETTSPSFLAIHPGERFLYAVGEVNDAPGNGDGTVSAFALEPKTGKLTLVNQQSSGDGGPCHLAVDATGKCLLVANYGSGTVAALRIARDGSIGEATNWFGHIGSSANPQRQAGPHAHFICPSPDNRFALACDLGLDQVIVYRFDADKAGLSRPKPLPLRRIGLGVDQPLPVGSPFGRVSPGSGPRHLAFSPDGKFVYVINEMASTITVFTYDPNTAVMTEAQTISTLPENYSAATNNSGAEIAVHPTGRFLYGSNRGHDSIAVFAVDKKSGQLTCLEYQSTQGKTPRHFAIDPTGRWLLAENQASDSVVEFSIDALTGKLKPTGQTLPIGSPVCAVFVGGHP